MPTLLCCLRPRSRSCEPSSLDRATPHEATTARGIGFSRPLPAQTPSTARHRFSLGCPSSGSDFDETASMRVQREAKARREAEQAERERQTAALAARQDPETVASARRLITGNMQLSANRPAVLREFERLMRSDEQGTPEDLAYKAMNNVMDAVNGSDNAMREQYGGYLRR